MSGRTPSRTPRPTEALSLRRALGQFTTGVTIVTCTDAGGAPVGLTVNSFNALSLDPPLVLWSLRETSASTRAFAAAGHFAVNVLAESQVELSRRFASPVDDKFAHGAWLAGDQSGAPLLGGCVAIFECETLSQQIAGDHHLFIGRVLKHHELPLAPLVYHGGHYRMLGEML